MKQIIYSVALTLMFIGVILCGVGGYHLVQDFMSKDAFISAEDIRSVTNDKGVDPSA